MDALFWVGQVVWLCVLACGAYLSFVFADLADEERARTVTPDKVRKERVSGEGSRSDRDMRPPLLPEGELG